MAFQIKNGIGIVTCDTCNSIMETDITIHEYNETLDVTDGDMCWRCYKKEQEKILSETQLIDFEFDAVT